MTTPSSLHGHTAAELGRLVRRREVSVEELTRYFLDRIERHNPALGAFTHVARRSALRQARRLDALGAFHRSPFYGVPIGIKDTNFVRFMPMQAGSRCYRYFVPPFDDPIAGRVRQAGMVILGKLATSEFAVMPVTETAIHPPTRNPYDLQRTAGGSSGGSGAAVAGGLLPIAQGSDGGGSIRIPAAVNHLVGYKPSRGRLLNYVLPDQQLKMTTMGPIAKSVEDAAHLAALWTASPWTPDLHLGESQLRGLKVGLTVDNPLVSTDPEHQSAARRVAKLFADQGATVEEHPWFDVPLSDFLIIWKRLAANVPLFNEGKLQPVTYWLRTEGKKIRKEVALSKRLQLGDLIRTKLQSCDLWITPTTAIAPPQIGAWVADEPEQSFRNIQGLGVFTAPLNFSGQPAISLPVGFSQGGLPIGVQLVGHLEGDDFLLQVANWLEGQLGGFRLTANLA